ncbi:MAG: signal peptidase I [Bacillota bacterium]|nr:signal peptidase I [Bacillota bacterium]
MKKTVKKVWNIVTSIIVALIVLLAIALVGVRLAGFKVFTVLSGSMEPTYHVGSLIYVRNVNYQELQSGDVITFMLDENTVATHRVVGVVPDDEDPAVIRFRTKGDANEAEDGALVHYRNVIGMPVFSIPRLGYVADYIQHPPGMYIAIAAGAVLLLLVFIPDLFEEDDKKRKARAHKEDARADSRRDSGSDPDAAALAERAGRLRQAAETLVAKEEHQALDGRLAQATQGETTGRSSGA